ncbi:hypothetical protein [Pseudomonas sp. Ga0074129]|uniref:hypothetical protein n=1 Tax=Pseudomonas sp. Ga0074129 TaxID=1752219 RepID=UPI000AB3ACA1|nr:hypothetical protein [Pseudomonas sp. Ga0074129]
MTNCPRVLVTAEAFALVVEPEHAPAVLVAAGEQGPPGPPGANAPGSDGRPIISADIDNRLKQGTDGGLHVLDDLIPNPLAYYILARS